MTWKIKQIPKKLPELNNPILIEGLPGIGNVGKITIDFIKEELKAKKVYDFFSYTFPHSVFVNDKNLVELPSIEMFYVAFNNKKKNDLLLLVGDVQPIDEKSSYEFCEELLNISKKLDVSEIITLGGVGLQSVPEKPKVYCTANNKRIISKYMKGCKLNNKLYGVVGPIVGVTGLMIGMSEKKDISAIALLAETFGHPMYLGIKGSREILKILNKKLNIKLNLKKLEEEIKTLEAEAVRKVGDFSQISKQSALKKIKQRMGKDVNYIG